MDKLKNIFIVLLLSYFLNQKLYSSEQLPSLQLSNNISFKIKYFPRTKNAYLFKHINGQSFYGNSSNGLDVYIPLKGKAENFKMILLNSGNILIYDTDKSEMVIFDQDENLLRNVKQSKKMIEEIKYDIRGLDKKELLKALFYAADFQGIFIIEMNDELTDEVIENLLNQKNITQFAGRILNINISEDYCDISKYNLENGTDCAQKAIVK